MNKNRRNLLQYSLASLTIAVALLVAVITTLNNGNIHIAPVETPQQVPEGEAAVTQEFTVVVDDFAPQPEPGQLIYPFNRLAGDRGALNDSLLEWGKGQVTTTIAPGNTWGGVWMSLNHRVDEVLPIDFSAILPPQILPAYQSQITGISARIARGTASKTITLELKDRDGKLQWKKESTLTGGRQVLSSSLSSLGGIKEFLWVLDDAAAADYVVLESVSFTATTKITDAATAAFVWSYGMLLNNWDPDTGLVRDKAHFASGEFDAIQATGSLAAATAVANQLGIVEREDARQIVTKIGDTLLLDTPRFHGLWPHFANVSETGAITIAPGTEWSSVDTVIAAIGLLTAQSGLSVDTTGSEEMLEAIDWDDLQAQNGISHGYTYAGDPIPYTWDVFGGESWLVELAHASARGQVTTLAHHSPPTANGSGFIDELAWLFVLPPTELDYWGNDWERYRSVATYTQTQYYPIKYPDDCFDKLGLFGLSAAEVPTPWTVPADKIYQAFGVGGRFAPPNDGTMLLEAPVVTPHYAAMIAALRPKEASVLWTWLINETPFSPLNNVESLMFMSGSNCKTEGIEWNNLKGSWNLALQTLGLGNYVLQRDGHIPVTWQTTLQNPFLREGYSLLIPNILEKNYLPFTSKP